MTRCPFKTIPALALGLCLSLLTSVGTAAQTQGGKARNTPTLPPQGPPPQERTITGAGNFGSPKEKALALAKEFSLDKTRTSLFVDLYVKYEEELLPRMENDGKAPAEGMRGAPDKIKRKDSLSDSEAEKMIRDMFSEQRRRVDVQEKYYPLFRKYLSPVQMMRIYSSPAPGGGPHDGAPPTGAPPTPSGPRR